MKPSPLIHTVLCLVCLSVRADVNLPALFSDRTVVQADAFVPVWGWAESGEEVTVSLAPDRA
jgi:hypothetical protein